MPAHWVGVLGQARLGDQLRRREGRRQVTEIRRPGVPAIFQHNIGEVLDYESPSRAMVVVEINYGTGAMALEPYAQRPVAAPRRMWQRIKDRVAAFVDRFEERNDPTRNP
jgi:hypothetical protein